MLMHPAAMVHHQLPHPHPGGSGGAQMYPQIQEVLWKQRYPNLPPMAVGHIPAVVAEELLDRGRAAAFLQERYQRSV